jgi:hypothetical protein
MNMLWALFSQFGGWLAGGAAIIAVLWGRTLRDRADGRADAQAQQAVSDLAAGRKAADIRRTIAALPRDGRQRLRDKYTRPE